MMLHESAVMPLQQVQYCSAAADALICLSFVHRTLDRTRGGAAPTTSTMSTLTQRKTWRCSCTMQPLESLSS